ncbi:MAG TPA: hypothetical protein VL325_11725 [Pyrinomonadaceae bacterium]|nr:hypothetical protein [Pyrinomonadaceae bacterium]
MSETFFESRNTRVFILAPVLLLPSIDTVQKYIGNSGVLLFLIAGTIIFAAAIRFVVPKYFSNLTDRQAIYIFVLILLLLIFAFAFLYPIANAHTPIAGSDQDDALDLAASDLLHGHYPYYQRTYLGNLIAPLPGSVLLAVPFVLLGYSAYQNLFWFAALFVAARSHLKGAAAALSLIVATLVFSPSVLQNMMTGIDRLANALYVLIFLQMTVTSISNERSSWAKIFWPLMLGIGLSSRANFVFIVPLLLATVAARIGWKRAAAYASVTVAASVIVTIPFWLYDPQGFSPLIVQYSKVGDYVDVMPHSGILVLIVTIALTIYLTLKRTNGDLNRLFLNCAIVQAFPVICSVILLSLHLGKIDLSLAGYGLFSLFFGAMAMWPRESVTNDNVRAIRT